MAVTLTEAAVAQVKRSLEKRGSGIGLRFGVKNSGCSGLAYVIDYADVAGDQDQVFETAGIQVIVDRESLPFVDGTRIDYRREGLNAAFKFENPQVTDQCGCGESFTTQSH